MTQTAVDDDALRAREDEVIVIAVFTGEHLFRHGPDSVWVSLVGGQETIVHADLSPATRSVRVSAEARYGILPRRRRLTPGSNGHRERERAS